MGKRNKPNREPSQPQENRPAVSPKDRSNSNLPRPRIITQTQISSGPLPPPEVLAEYDKVIPNGVERIVAMAERQSAHRQRMEKWTILGGTILSYVGVLCAATITLAAFYLGYQLILKGHVISGTLFAGSSFTGLIGAFIYGTHSRKEERLEKERLSKDLTGIKSQG